MLQVPQSVQGGGVSLGSTLQWEGSQTHLLKPMVTPKLNSE